MVLCVVLLSGAGLMIRSAVNSYNAPIGVNFANVLTMQINLPEAKYTRAEDEISFHRRLKAKLESLPGVESVSLASAMPSQPTEYFSYEVDGRPPADPRDRPVTGGVVVGADYFRVMQVRPRRGRVFTESDGISGAPAVIVNETFAAKAWPGEDPIAKRIRLVRGPQAPAALFTVVGLVPDIKQNPNQPLEQIPLIYVSYPMDPPRAMYLAARTAVPPLSLVEAFRREAQALDADLAVYDVATLEHRVNQNRLNEGIFAVLFGLFAGVALVLAAVGLYAVVAHAVSQRRREIGVRMAVGGTAGDIMRLVFWQGMRWIVIGLAIGLPLGAAVTFVLRAGLVGVAPGDPLSMAGAALVLIFAGLLGCGIPALRAVRVDPMIALRCD
jgi:putative ABC transport system permease protein